MSIELEFRKWIDHLRRLNLPVAQMLLPGLEAGSIRHAISDVGLECPDDLVEFYTCCGGVGAPDGTLLNHMWMFGSHYVLPFKDAVENYRVFSLDHRWERAWFPFLANDGGDFYSLVCLGGRSDWRQISYFRSNTGDSAQIRYSSILNMLTVINECFDSGVCYVDAEGNLETKFLEAGLIAMKHNPELPYYQ